MESVFIEASSPAGNWGKFMVARWTRAEWERPSAVAESRSLLSTVWLYHQNLGEAWWDDPPREVVLDHPLEMQGYRRPGPERKWYLLACRECDQAWPGEDKPPVTMPFESAEARGRWAGAHTRGTGHKRWLVIDEPREAS